MGVLLQAFYWDCPKEEKQEFNWWNFLIEKLPDLKKAGFTALWLPPACKAANIGGMSMGYDPYDFFDLGEFDQKGSVKTWYGSKDDLIALIKTIHAQGMQAYADLVLNHNNGADEQEINPLDNQKRWTKFKPVSGRFPRNWECFHPSLYERWDNREFGEMPDLCHRNPYVYSEMMELARWLIEDIGYDGFRYDFVLGYGGWLVKSMLERRYNRHGRNDYAPFGVGECWDNERDIDEWLGEVNNWSDNPGSAFDFPLRDKLKNLCDSFGYNLTDLAAGNTLSDDEPLRAVTFVENHDIIRQDPITNEKMLAYAWILTHEGYPCVFWQDYFNFSLAKENTSNGIAALIKVHEQYANGDKKILYADEVLYIMQREGSTTAPGLIFVLNNEGNSWQGKKVQAKWSAAKFIPVAWYSRFDAGVPEPKQSDENGYSEFWAPPRGYAVYVKEAK
jgi:alpha-amylase